MDPRHEVYAARMHLELRRGATPRIAFLVLAVLAAVATGLAPGAMRAQDPSPTASSPALTLAGRLPAQIDGSPVQLDETTDLAAYLEAAYAGETGPELDALDAALADQGVSPAEVELVWASAFDSEVLIGGFRLPGGDASAFREALLGVYFLGFDGLEQAEMDVQGRSVTTVSQGPVADDPYPFAVLTDGDTLWIASVSSQLLEPTVTALVGAAGGTVARYDTGAVVDAGYAAPWGWEGTVSLTTTWNKNSYRGTSSARMTGTWLQPLTTIAYCEDDCTTYIPTGTIEWTWDVSAPTTPRCSASTRGSLPSGGMRPEQQGLFLDPTDDGHVRYWGSGVMLVPDQPCVGWESAHQPSSFFDIPMPEDADPAADELGDARPPCFGRQWRIPADETRISGRCWRYDEQGYEEVIEWDLVAVEE